MLVKYVVNFLYRHFRPVEPTRLRDFEFANLKLKAMTSSLCVVGGGMLVG